jgi:hypothetical protein
MGPQALSWRRAGGGCFFQDGKEGLSPKDFHFPGKPSLLDRKNNEITMASVLHMRSDEVL